MKLATKLTLGLALGILVVMSVNAYVRVEREVNLFETERRADELAFGRVLRASVEAVWESEGDQRATELVALANDAMNDVQFRWVWLDEIDAASPIPLSDTRQRELAQARSPIRTSANGYQYLYVPIRRQGGRPAALEIAESLDFQNAYLRDSILQVAATTLGVTAVCGLIAMGLGVFFVGRPVRHLYEQTRRIGKGDFSQRLSIPQRDEIGELAGAINAMSDQLASATERARRETETRIAALEQLRHADRLKTIGQLASGVAHELGTPLNVVAGHARIIAKDPEGRDAVANGARVIAEQADRMTTIIRQLLDFARRRTPKLESWDMTALARDTIAMLAPIAKKNGASLELTGGTEPVFANIDRFQAQQVITNLAMNAIQAVRAGGHVELNVDTAAGSNDGEFVRLTVSDDGPGIPADARPHVFEPFFTTKGVGEGTGLGLSVAYGIVQEHGGRIDVSSESGHGTTFTVYFQAAHTAPSGA